MSKQIEQFIAKGRIALDNSKSISEIASAMLEPVADEQVPVFPPMPKAVVLDDETKKALRRLGDVFAVVQPESRRALTEAEQQQVFDEQQVLKRITTLLSTREEALKEIIRHHMDVAAEEQGRADEETPRDAKGHYILAAPQNPEHFDVPGTNQAWSREFKRGSVGVNTQVLDQMLEDGDISRDVYLAMTVEKRVFDENKALTSAAKPALRDEVLRVIKAMTTTGKPGTSLFTRKSK